MLEDNMPREQSVMNQKFLRLSAIAVGISTFLPTMVAVASLEIAEMKWSVTETVLTGGYLAFALFFNLGLIAAYKPLRRKITPICADHGQFMDGLSGKTRTVALFLLTALSLFMELAVIRWLAGEYPFFSFYKNYVLLACFLGLGCGYAIAGEKSSSLPMALPLMLWLILLCLVVRNGMPYELSFSVRNLIPFTDQLHVGVGNIQDRGFFFIGSHFFLGTIFLLTALAFVPVGQACGRLMEGMPKLRAYGINLLGSLAGTALMLGVSSVWLPPTAWFAACFMVILWFLHSVRQALAVGAFCAAAAVVLQACPWNPTVQQIYSPYQLIERSASKTGLMQILAGGTSFQEVFDYSFANAFGRSQKSVHGQVDYYEFPYQVRHRPDSVAVMGAGSGNDVAAALRMGAHQVDAVEIDPAIVALGAAYHPEHPYSDPRVILHVTDARTFIRNTDKKFDLIVFGLLDSHTVLSQASSVRVDSFVYTTQSFKEARKLLKDDGIMCVTFTVAVPEVTKKFFMMLTEAFDGIKPICLGTNLISGNFIFVQGKNRRPEIPGQLLNERGWQDVTGWLESLDVQAEPPTDDWPFVYMPKRIYPTAYIPMMIIVLVISIAMSRGLLGTVSFLDFRNVVFFLLGSGFMLIETKAITELGLAFGNTWQVIGIAISGILFMAFIANYVVARFDISRVTIPYLLLGISLVVGYSVAVRGGFAPTAFGKLSTLALLTCPVIFSGIVFSSLLKRGGNVSEIMAANLLGAMCGGLIEYNSMYFGFAALYIFAFLLYAAAFLAGSAFLKKPA